MRGSRHFLILAAAALGLAGCIRDPDPFHVDTDDIAVHALLVAGADTATVFVERPGQPIPGAEVRLIRGADTTLLAFSDAPCAGGFGPGVGCFRGQLDTPLAAGGEYELEVVLPEGHRITGSTTVPAPPTIVAPAERERIPANCSSQTSCYGAYSEQPPYFVPVAAFEVELADSVDQRLRFMWLEAGEVFLDDQVYPAGSCTLGYAWQEQRGSLRWLIPNIYCPPPLNDARFDSIHAEVAVHVVNAEYADYLDALQERTTRDIAISAGLEGAWGVFGGMAIARRAITLVRVSPPT